MIDSLKRENIVVVEEMSRLRKILLKGNISEERRKDLQSRLEQLKVLNKMGKKTTSYYNLM